ncbi:hypothetical protein AB0D38_06950 [Streptomyces sp. NPDC048279]|uniref:hypothetical protein n=1 Tax=Streptomyces sp. NPDC048279 TaxID=3154714 RepID=UPI00341328C4
MTVSPPRPFLYADTSGAEDPRVEVVRGDLTEGGHGSQEYVVTGVELVSVGDRVVTVAGARGRESALLELTEEQAVAQRWAAGHPEDVIGFPLEVYGHAPEGGRTVADTVEKVTGAVGVAFVEVP